MSQLISLLQQAQWFKDSNQIYKNPPLSEDLPVVTDTLLKRWKSFIKDQEDAIKHARQNASQIHHQVNIIGLDTAETESDFKPPMQKLADCPQTDTHDVVKQPTQKFLDPNDVVKEVASNFKFNEKQFKH